MSGPGEYIPDASEGITNPGGLPTGYERLRQFVWNGDDRVSNDRGCWGRIRLSK